jgi:hypothetical protein
MMDDRNGLEKTWVYFTQERGGTWVNWDNALFLWIGEHLILLGLGISILLGSIIWIAIRCTRVVRRRGWTSEVGKGMENKAWD